MVGAPPFTVAAYGQLLAVHAANAALAGASEASFKSNLGYSGEQWDASLRMQNLRARAYDPANGRFIGLDPFAGNMQDPQSLHKYAYVHGDPIQGIDPTGMFLGSAIVIGAIALTSYAALLAVSEAVRLAERNWSVGNGGLDITHQIDQYVVKYKAVWNTKSTAEKQAILDFMYYPTSGLSGWDTDVLTDVAEQKIFTNSVVNAAPRTVTFRNKVYYAHELNYLLWGIANGVAYSDSSLPTSSSYGVTATTNFTGLYRLIGGPTYFLLGARHGGTIPARQDWARAGWNWAVNGTLSEPKRHAHPYALPTYRKNTYALQARVGRYTTDPAASPIIPDQIKFSV